MPGEMVVRQVEEIDRAQQHDDLNVLQPHREQDRDDAEGKRADDAVAKRLALLGFWQAKDQHGEHHGVVSAEQAFESDEKSNCEEVGGRDVQAVPRSYRSPAADWSRGRGRLDPTRIKSYTQSVSRVIDLWQRSGTTAANCSSSAWQRKCWACIRRRSASTNGSDWCVRRGRSAACACIHARSSNACA